MKRIKEFFPRKSWLKAMMARDDIEVKGTVVAVLTRADGSIERYHGLNIVTNAGDQYYAQLTAGESPTKDFKASVAGLRLGTGIDPVEKGDLDVTAFLAGSAHVRDAGYPKTDDDDPNNEVDAGPNVLTWRYSYLTSEGNGLDISEGGIADDRTTPTVLLNHFLFDAPFPKTSADTLAVSVNHKFLGV